MDKKVSSREESSIIKDITSDPSQMETSLAAIRDSFKTVADQFGLTEENCPAHPAFLTMPQLLDMKARGLTLFGLFTEGVEAGFIAVEKSDGGVFWIEKLAVLPAYRGRKYGERLVRQATDYATTRGGNKVCLGMIDKHKVLKDWYKGLGFRDVGTRDFPGLPFTVCFMEKDLA